MARGKGGLPRTMTQREAIQLLERYGWTRTTGGGHTVKMVKPGHRPVTLSHHRGQAYSVSYTQRILKQSGLKRE